MNSEKAVRLLALYAELAKAGDRRSDTRTDGAAPSARPHTGRPEPGRSATAIESIRCRLGSIFVPGSGDPDAGVVLIGEAPGRDEERLGRPFVGAAGKNLDLLLAHAGLSREHVFITNLVKFRPHTISGRNRKPSAQESRRARSDLLRELAILAPNRLVCLGASAASALLGRPRITMGQANGALFDADGRALLVTYHPSPFNFCHPQRRTGLFKAFSALGEWLKTGVPPA